MDMAWVAYYDNSQLSHKGNYKNSNKEGAWVGYLKDGTVFKDWTGTFKDGKKTSD
jgi:antitoxin component YwqK of YwqJK toxin-antitoxin module